MLPVLPLVFSDRIRSTLAGVRPAGPAKCWEEVEDPGIGAGEGERAVSEAVSFSSKTGPGGMERGPF